MANGRLLDGDRNKLHADLIPWSNLYKTQVFPLTPEESEDMLWYTFEPRHREALRLLVDDNEMRNYIETSTRHVDLRITDEQGIHGGAENGTCTFRVAIPDGAVIPKRDSWGSSAYRALTPDNPYFGQVTEWSRKVSEIAHNIATCKEGIYNLMFGAGAINTYGQLKRVWPDIIQVVPESWQQHIAQATRSSRLPDERSPAEWRAIQSAFEKVTAFAVQALMLRNADRFNYEFDARGFDEAASWKSWVGEVKSVPPLEEVKLPWE